MASNYAMQTSRKVQFIANPGGKFDDVKVLRRHGGRALCAFSRYGQHRVNFEASAAQLKKIDQRNGKIGITSRMIFNAGSYRWR